MFSQICTSANVRANVLQICIVAKMNWHWLPILMTKFALHLQLLQIKCKYIFSSRDISKQAKRDFGSLVTKMKVL